MTELQEDLNGDGLQQRQQLHFHCARHRLQSNWLGTVAVTKFKNLKLTKFVLLIDCFDMNIRNIIYLKDSIQEWYCYESVFKGSPTISNGRVGNVINLLTRFELQVMGAVALGIVHTNLINFGNYNFL